MDFKNIDFENLNFEEIGIWPKEMKLIVFILVLFTAFVAGYFLILQGPISEYTSYSQEEQDKREEFRTSYLQAINLDAYKIQMTKMQNMFRELIRMLPSEEKMPALLEELSQQSAAAGVRLNLVKPAAKVNMGFYGELPLELEIIGDYNSIGKFMDNIAKLSRVITLHDFKIAHPETSRRGSTSGNTDTLVMRVLAKTYWSLDKGGQ